MAVQMDIENIQRKFQQHNLEIMINTALQYLGVLYNLWAEAELFHTVGISSSLHLVGCGHGQPEDIGLANSAQKRLLI